MFDTTPYHEGSNDASICFIGEAPSIEEMRQRRPFVGQSGQILNEVLQKSGISRMSSMIENVCRTPISSSAAYVTPKGLTPKGREAAADLLSRISRSKANVFVPMGNLSLAVMTGMTSITKYRGSILPSTLLPNRQVIPTIHPAATLPFRGKFLWRFAIVDDLRKVKRHATHNDVRLPNRTYHLVPTFHQVLDFLGTMIQEKKKTAFDIECINHEVSCISFSNNPAEAMSIPFVPFEVPGAANGHAWSEEEEITIWLAIAKLLGNPDIEKCIQNCMFDTSFLLLRNKIVTRGKIADPMLRSRIMFPDLPAKLEYLTSIYTDEPYYKDDKKLWKNPGKDPLTFYRYNARDSVCALEADNALVEIMAGDPEYTATYDETISMMEPCLYLMSKGMKIHEETLKASTKKITARLNKHKEDLRAIWQQPFNPISSAQCCKYFYGVKGIKPYTKRRKKKDGTEVTTPTCDDKALARIISTHKLPEARLVQDIRNLSKLLGTYMEMRYDDDGYLRCSYNIRGTTTTRLSSSKTVFETGTNMQNLDPRFKEFLMPQTLLERFGNEG